MEVTSLTVSESVLWWEPATLQRICDWSQQVADNMPDCLRRELGTSSPSDPHAALGLLHLLHDAYDVAPQYRLYPDEISELKHTAATASLFFANADIQQHAPWLLLTGALSEVQRGFASYLPTNNDNDAGDRVFMIARET